ncbi:hypothetical protein OG389_02375 [Streptomyces sp. NBC_00435]
MSVSDASPAAVAGALMDVRMPRCNGIGATRRLLAEPAAPAEPPKSW